MTDTHEFQLKIKGPDTSWEITIEEGSMIIGRQVGNDLLLEHPQISRRHATIDCTPETCYITDLNSSNGTFVNEGKITPGVQIQLKPGDVLKIGPFILELSMVEVEVPTPEEQPATKDLGAPPLPVDIHRDEVPQAIEAVEEPIEPAKKLVVKSESKPPQPPHIPPRPPGEDLPPISEFTTPGISKYSTRLINYLPDIYHTDFMSRFLGIFESILTPIEWNIDSFDMYLSPGTTPSAFISWFANLFQISFDQTWRVGQRRELLKQAHKIYAMRGTKWALSQVLEIYTGVTPEINDQVEKQDPFLFSVNIPIPKSKTNPELIEALINVNKPAHTTYELHFKAK
jgi:phage tail-like protein